MNFAYEGCTRALVADSQYSSRRFRGEVADCGVVAVIPYPSNQRKGEDVLRVDRYFRIHGSEEERRLYGLGRSSIERVNSRLEGQVCLDRHRVARAYGVGSPNKSRELLN